MRQMDAEQAETYLRLAVESALRWAGRAGKGQWPGLRKVRAVADAFQGAGVLPAEVAESVVDGLQSALVVRSPGLRLARAVAANAGQWTRGSAWTIGQPLTMTPVGQFLPAGGAGSDVGIYLLALASTPKGAWLSAVVHQRRPGEGGPFGLAAVDVAGRAYRLVFAGTGDGPWQAGQLAIFPLPPDGTEWLEVSYGTRTLRVDLTGPAGGPASSPPPAPAAVTAVSLAPAEAYLRARAEAWLAVGLPPEADDLLEATAALTAIGALPSPSPLAAQVAALTRRDAAGLPQPWADALAHRDRPRRAPAHGLTAAHLTVSLPAVDGLTVVLGGVTSGPLSSLYGALLTTGDDTTRIRPSCWIRDWTQDAAGPWRLVPIAGWEWADGHPDFAFHSEIYPAIPSSATSAEILVTGQATEARAMVPLHWWLH